MTAQIHLVCEKKRFLCFFHLFFQKNLGVKKNYRIVISHCYSGLVSGYSRGLQIWSPRMLAQILFVLEKWRFL